MATSIATLNVVNSSLHHKWPNPFAFESIHNIGPIGPETLAILRSLILNSLARELGDEKAQREIENASLDAIIRVVERLRPKDKEIDHY